MSLYDYYEKIYALEAQGKKIIRLTAADPDWRPSSVALDALVNSIKAGKDKYASALGIPVLRKKIAAMHGCSEENVIVFPGSKMAVFATLFVKCKSGDNVVTFAPYWGAYSLMCKKLGLEFKQVDLTAKSNFEINWSEVEKAIDFKTKVFILNSPCNPTGIAFREEDEYKLIQLCKSKGVLVLCDDAYRDLSFDERKDRKLEEGIVIAQTWSKTFGMTGWRLGYVVSDEATVREFAFFNQLTISNVPVFLQEAALAALEEKEEVSKIARGVCKERLVIASEVLKGVLEFAVPNSSFYVYGKLPGKMNGTDFAYKLLEEGVAIVPGEEFGGEKFKNYVRISLCFGKEPLRNALEVVARLVRELS